MKTFPMFAAGAFVALGLAACDSPLDPVPADQDLAIQPPIGLETSFATTGVIGVDIGFVYTAVDLGSLGAGTFHAATSINNRGRITGMSGVAPGVSQAFYWTPESGIQGIPTGGALASEAWDISTNDEVVGTLINADGTTDAYTWSPGGGLNVLGHFGGAWAQGKGINDSGAVVGYYQDPTGLVQAYVRMSDGTFQVLPWVPNGLPVSPYNTALDINNSTEVVGLTLDNPLSPAPNLISYYWSPTNPGGAESLGSLGPEYGSHTVWSINEAGEVAGAAFSTDGTTVTPFVWTRTGGFRDLRSEGFPAELLGSAVEANSLGYVAVSVLDLQTGTRTPSIWVPQYGLVYLPTLGGDSGEVFGINDLGQAVGWSQDAAGDTVATLWDLTFPPDDAIGGQVQAIDQIIATQTDPVVQEELNHAAVWLEDALDELNQEDPDMQRVLELLGRAVEEIGKAEDAGFDPILAEQLVQQQVEAARTLAQEVIDGHIAAGVKTSKLRKATRAMEKGDALAAAGRYEKAIEEYLEAVEKADKAAGKRERKRDRDEDEDHNGCPRHGRHNGQGHQEHGNGNGYGHSQPGKKNERHGRGGGKRGH